MSIVVVGAGQAGHSLVAKLRQLGYAGDLTLLGLEPVPPYQRPPLSKAYLLGDMGLDRLLLRPANWYREQNITLKTGCVVSAINRDERKVVTPTGAIPYDQLALTTGARPRRLPADIGGDLAGVYTLRSLNDVDLIRPEFVAGRRVLVVGGGYIGLEAAAVAARLGLKVTLVEAAPRILQRVASAETSTLVRALHRQHGVVIREGIGLRTLLGDHHVTAAELTDGTKVLVDFVIVGVGILPETTLAEAAGLSLDNGISCNAFGQTSDPAIWAAGDCASFPSAAGAMRLESVGNAIDMGENVAANMLGASQAYVPKPWFWSDQFDCKLQIAGLSTGYDRVMTRKGDGEGTSLWYYRADHLIAVDALNDARAYMVGKRLIDAGRSVPPEVIADPTSDLKALLKP